MTSEGGQDTSACQISGNTFHGFSGNCPEIFLDGEMDGQAEKQSGLVKWTKRHIHSGKMVFKAMERQTAQKHNASGT